MDEERCVDNCAGKLIRSNHRLMGTYVQLMPRMVQRRMEELESKAAENAKLEAEAAAAAAANVGPESQATPVTLSPTVPITANEAPQNPLELNTNDVGLLGATQLTPTTENILDSGTSVTVGFPEVQSTEPAPYEPPKAAFLPEDVPVTTTSVPQKSTENGAGPE